MTGAIHLRFLPGDGTPYRALLALPDWVLHRKADGRPVHGLMLTDKDIIAHLFSKFPADTQTALW